jgi:hypothetical protein
VARVLKVAGVYLRWTVKVAGVSLQQSYEHRICMCVVNILAEILTVLARCISENNESPLNVLSL